MEAKRKAYNDIVKHLDAKEFTIVTGARQIGKTTLLRQIFDETQVAGKNSVFLNLERKEVLADLNENPENVFKYGNTENERLLVFIDEVQYLNDPSNFLKLLYDEYKDKVKLVVTGSSAFYIDTSFRDSLAGRKKIFELRTLDFEEFLQFKKEDKLLSDVIKLKTDKIKKSTQEARIKTLLEEYIIYGGYPTVTLSKTIEEKIEKLDEIKNSYVKRDITDSGVSNDLNFYKLLQMLSNQTGNLLNINELSKALRMSNATIENYLYILQKCFHISLVKPFYSNLKKELVKMPKLYFNDLGLRNSILNYFAPLDTRLDKGALLENYAYLLITDQKNKDFVKYWRTADGNEVDFVFDDIKDKKAIEVKFSTNEINQKKYTKFKEAYPDYPLTFMSWQGEGLLM